MFKTALHALRKGIGSIVEALNSLPEIEVDDECYKCHGLGQQFSHIDGSSSTCEWCNGTGVVEKYRAQTADDIVDNLFFGESYDETQKRRRARWGRRR